MGEMLLAGLFVLVSAVGIAHSLGLPYLAEFGFGPGFFPLWLSVGMFACSLVVLAQAFRRRHVSLGDGTARQLTPLVIAGCLVVATLVLDRLGFFITAWAMTLVLLRITGKLGLLTATGVSTAAVAVIWVVFVRLLGVSLGRGPLGF